MIKLTRRAAAGALAALPLARPGIIQAQTSSAPIRIGLLSDVGGPGSKLATEMAVEDFGGSVLGRPAGAGAAGRQPEQGRCRQRPGAGVDR